MDMLTLAHGGRIALTALFAFALLFALTKLAGNKQISQMTMFDYVSGISTGSIAAELATELEAPLYPLIGLLVFGAATFLIGIWTNKSLAARRIFTGRPLVLYDNDRLYRENLKTARLDLSEFLTLCRIGGYFDLSQLQTAVMEPNGSLSFLPKEPYRAAQVSDLGIKPKQSPLFLPVIMDGKVQRRNLSALGKNEKWIEKHLKAQNFRNAGEVLLALAESGGAVQFYPMKTGQRAKEAE